MSSRLGPPIRCSPMARPVKQLTARQRQHHFAALNFHHCPRVLAGHAGKSGDARGSRLLVEHLRRVQLYEASVI